MKMTLRRGQLQDVERAGSICYEAFKSTAEKHGFPPDFPSAQVAIELYRGLFGRPDVYTAVAEVDGLVVGSNILWENAVIAGIGPITIDPGVQNQEIGKQLMNHVLERTRSRGVAGVRLVQAAYHNRSLALYTKLGFAVREPLATLQGAPLNLAISGFTVRPAAQVDLDACNRVCCEVHGHDRGQELANAIALQTARVVEHDGRITGYTTQIGFFGHACGETNDDLKALIGDAAAIAGPGLLMPIRNAALFRWCLNRGLRVVQPMTLMSRGFYNEPAGACLPSIVF